MSYSLGVDLGTTWTAAAVWRDGRASTVPLADHSDSIPSAVFLRPDGVMLVGEAAVRRGELEPDRLARGFKRRLGDPAPFLLGDETVTAPELTGQLLRWVVGAVSAREGEMPAHVTLTCPATWGEHHRELLTAAATEAQLPEVGLLPEPVAVAIHYAARERLEVGSTTAVYDLGGGTFDAALVLRTDRGYELRGRPGGDESIGGEDFDDAVLEHVRRSLGNALTLLDTGDDAVLAGLAQVRRNAVAAKEALSNDLDTTIAVILPGVTRSVRLTRSELESALRVPLLRTVDALEQVIRTSGLELSQVQAVLLAGGSSRIPLVSELLATELGLQVLTDTHPKHAVCLGAAIAAAAVPERRRPAPAAREAAPPTRDADPAVLLVPEPTAPDAAVRARPEDVGVLAPVDVRLPTTPDVRRPLRHLSDRDELRVEHRGDLRRGRRSLALAVAGVATAVALVTAAAAQGWLPGAAAPDPPPTSSGATDPVQPTSSGPAQTAPAAVLTAQPLPAATGEVVRAVAGTGGGLVAVGGTVQDPLPRVWLGTADGWSPGSAPALGAAGAGGVNGVTGGAGLPLVAVGWSSAADADPADPAGRRGEVWVSADGGSWVRAEVPEVGELADVVRLPDGSLLAAGTGWADDPADGDGVLLASADGARWQPVPTTGLDGPGPFDLRRVVADPAGGLVALGARLDGGVLRSGLWTSPDGGAWTPASGLSGSGSGVADAYGLAPDPDGGVVVVGSESALGSGSRAVVWRGPPTDPLLHVTGVERARLLGVAPVDAGLVVVGSVEAEDGPAPAAWSLGW